jgi:hypothetical protein
MIEFTQEGTRLKVKINTGVSVQRNIIVLEWDTTDELYARLLTDQIRSRFEEQTRTIREDAYNKGWDEKQKRKIKRTWFRSFFGKENW